MTYKHTALTACFAALSAGLAQADIFIPYGAPEFGYESPSKISGNAGIDYSTKYVSRGLASQDADTDSNFLFSAMGQYKLNKKGAIVVGGSFNWFVENGLDHGDDHKDGGYCDEFNGIIEYAHHFTRRTVLAGGYQFVHGGLPGILNPSLDGNSREFPPFFDNDRPEEHSLVLDLHHEFAKLLEGFFWDSRVQYTFRWADGFWFTNTFGYKHELNEKTDIIVSATWNASMNYFEHDSLNSNGTQGYSLNIAAPTKVTERVRITPHAGLHFIGNGGRAAEHRAGDVYRDTTFVLGVKASYVF